MTERIPSAPRALNASPISITCAVLFPPAPARTGTLARRASSMVISTTRRCSALLKVGLSPVVPQGTRKLMPAPICRCTNRRSAFSSSERSWRNGVTIAVPHPVNISPSLASTLLQLVHNLPKIEKAFLAGHPAGRAQGSARKSLAAARGMADGDRIGRGIEAYLVRSGMRAAAAAAGVNRLGVALFFHLLNEGEQRSGGRILFRRVVNLPGPRAVLRLAREQPRRLRHNLIKDKDAHREIRAPDQSRAGAFNSGSRAIELAEPAGGPDYRVHSQSREPLDILRCGRWRREFHRRVNAAEILAGQAFEFRVVVHVEAQLHVESAFRSELLDQPPHFSVSDNRQIHCASLTPSPAASLPHPRTFRRRPRAPVSRCAPPECARRGCFPVPAAAARPRSCRRRGRR